VTTDTSTSPWARLAAILIGTFVGTLANSTANVALPAVMADFAVPLSSALWVVTTYTLVFAVFMPVCGYLGDLYGQRRAYLWGMALFAVASLGAGLAPSLSWLLGWRVLQGIAIAPTLPAVMAIMARTFSPETRGRAMGFWALVNGAGHTLGPALSGFLTQQLGWRAVFLSGLPLCLINLLLVWWLVPSDDVRTVRGFDFGGAATLTVAALGLMVALAQSALWGWGSLRSLGVWGLAMAALAVFVVVERRVASPFVELGLFTNRQYAAATGVISAQIFDLFGLLLAVPFFLMQVQGWSSQMAGLLVLPLPLAMALVAPLAGRLADARGSRWTCRAGMAPRSGQRVPWWTLVGSLAVVGLGMGLTQSPVAAAVTHVVRKDQLGVATGIFHMCRFVSGSLGSTVFGLVLQASAAGVAVGFRRDLFLLIALAVLAALVARGLPGSHPAPGGPVPP
jgi:EmrB/QacA subfamily drug resistance transporter